MSDLNVREMQEQREHETLSLYAAFSDRSLGRDKEEEPCDIRPCYQRDRDRIIHSKAFRRLKLKTQVFLAPLGDHYRTRLIHTLEVSQNARTIARALKLNEDLTEAIALGHDLGHTPFGHAGERALNRVYKEGFRHCEQSVRVVELLEKHGEGLNLTKEVRDGILNHKTSGNPMTYEGKIVRLSDKIAYINADIDDAVRANIITEESIPLHLRKILGSSTRQRINTIIHDIIINSQKIEDIAFSDEINQAVFELRKYMFENVYTNPIAKAEETKAEKLVEHLFEYYNENIDKLPEDYQCLLSEDLSNKERIVCDYIAGMTDNYAVEKYKALTIPVSWSIV